MNQPYKLLSIFEQWASEEGITDHLSGDTLKTALERGSPDKRSSRK
jgi:quinol monooxygenase YgiN